MNNAKFILPCVEYKQQYIEMVQEWINTGEELVPWVLERDYSDFDALIKYLYDQSIGLVSDGWVANTTYWLVDKSVIVGVINIRHSLNEKLLKTGGNIGYGIRPTMRNKGYGKLQLHLALEKCREIALSRVLITCDKTNPVSAGVIIANGGKLENEFTEEDGNVVQRYWIELE